MSSNSLFYLCSKVTGRIELVNFFGLVLKAALFYKFINVVSWFQNTLKKIIQIVSTVNQKHLMNTSPDQLVFYSI